MKEQEIDELLEFAYELDYEKYMEDYEVRQALALIKERVTEIAKDQDWKQKMADDWNQANAEIDAKDQDKKSTVASKYPSLNAFRVSRQWSFKGQFQCSSCRS